MANSIALGQSTIQELRRTITEANDIIVNQMADQYNTFQYVVKNLDNWASEVAVGSSLRQKMQQRVETVKSLMDGSRELYRALENLADLQEKINNTME